MEARENLGIFVLRSVRSSLEFASPSREVGFMNETVLRRCQRVIVSLPGYVKYNDDSRAVNCLRIKYCI